MFEQVARAMECFRAAAPVECSTELVVWITPPITTVPPSVTSTCVVACCVIRVGLFWT